MLLAVAALAVAAIAGAAISQAETTRKGSIQVGVDGKLAPKKLPRHGKAPVTVSFSGKITSTDPAGPPQLTKITVAINRHGILTYHGIPNCRMRRIDPSTTQAAIRVCRSSLVGTGHFSADVRLPEQSPFPSEGKVLAFNGRFKGRPAVLAHIYGTKPVPTSYVLPFTIAHLAGAYGTELEAALPRVTGNWGYVTGIALKLNRRFRFNGSIHSYLAADCPAPKGISRAVFPLARTSFSFDGGTTLTSVLNRTCKVRR